MQVQKIISTSIGHLLIDAIAAEMFGKIIISEIFVPKKYKTIKPVTGLGGYAGGTLKILFLNVKNQGLALIIMIRREIYLQRHLV